MAIGFLLLWDLKTAREALNFYAVLTTVAFTTPGNLWTLGTHSLLCGEFIN